MTVKPAHQVVAEQLNALLDQVEQGPWDHYEAGRDREAIQAALALKEFSVRYKDSGATAAYQAAPPGDMPPPDVLAALAAAYQAAAGDWNQVKAALAQVSTPAATKTAKMSPLEAAVKGYSWDGR